MESLEQKSGHPAQIMSVKDWVVTSIITAIPLVGFIMLFVWAFGDGTNPNKANWAKASLLIMLIFMVLGFVFVMLIGGFAALTNMNA